MSFTPEYILTQSIITTECGTALTYGISGKTVKADDISTDKAKVEDMLGRINKEKLEECHFSDFISDETDR